MLFQIMQTNYACMIICVLFFIFVVTDRSFNRRIEAMFISVMGIVLILMLVDNLELIEAQRSHPTFARSIYSAIIDTFRPGVVIMTTIIMERNRIQHWGRKKILRYSSLAVINAFFAILSIFNKCVFGYTTENGFYRGIVCDRYYYGDGLSSGGSMEYCLWNRNCILLFIFACLCLF